MPFFRNSRNMAMKSIAGGWELSGIVTMESGLPLNITLGGAQGSNGVDNGTNRPNFTGSAAYNNTRLSFFNTTGFSAPAVGQWGTLSKGLFRGPGRDNWNLSMFKQFVLNESRGSRIELRVETFNTWNHTEFNGVDTSATSGTFGQVTSMWDPRVFQLGGKFIW